MVQPSSIDLRCDRYFRVFENHKYAVIDPKAPQSDLTSGVTATRKTRSSSTRASSCSGRRSRVVGLADDIVARLEGKSSLGRLGLLIHSTAGFIDPGFVGQVTLELSNVANLPIAIYPDMKIGQISFYQMSTPAESRTDRRSSARSTRASEGPQHRRCTRTSGGDSDRPHATVGAIMIDCHDPEALVEFWSAITGVEVAARYPQYIFCTAIPGSKPTSRSSVFLKTRL